MSDFIRKEICEGVAFNFIKDNRFKTGRISATLIVPLSRETAAANALLSCVLTRSCRKYPDFTTLGKKLDSLYGASLYPSVRRIGDFQAITVSISGLEDKFALDDFSVSSELTDLLCSIIFEPNIIDGHFSADDVEQERRQLIENIDADFNDKRTYAIKRCTEIMCKDELFSIGRFGTREDVVELENDDIYRAWKNLLDNAQVELTMIGNTDPENTFNCFKKYFENRPRRNSHSTQIISNVKEVKRIMETEDLAQSKLVMGFRCAYPENNEAMIANSLMSAILGGIPTSKLFTNVREKMSLCYYCVSRVDNQKGIMLIDSGVETKNIQKTEKAILEQLDLLIKGEITEEELNSAKLALKNSYISSLDSPASMQGFFISNILRKSPLTLREAADIVDNITLDQIVFLAREIKLDTVFSLIGNDD